MSAIIDSTASVRIARQQTNRVREVWLRASSTIPAGAAASPAYVCRDRSDSDTGCVTQDDWCIERAGLTISLDALTGIVLARYSYCVQQDDDQHRSDEASNDDRRHVVWVQQHLPDAHTIDIPVTDKLTIKRLVTITQCCEHSILLVLQ